MPAPLHAARPTTKHCEVITMFERTRTTVTEHKTALLVILLIMLLLILGIVFSSEEQPAPEKPTVMTQE